MLKAPTVQRLKVAYDEVLSKSAFKINVRLYNAVGGICPDSEYARYGTIPEWDVSLITNMSGAFKDRDTFNGDITLWNTTLVQSMVGRCKLSVLETHVESAWFVGSTLYM